MRNYCHCYSSIEIRKVKHKKLDKLARLTAIWIREQGDGNAVFKKQASLKPS